MKLWLAAGAAAVTALLVSVLFLRGQAPGEAADAGKDKRTITTAGTATLKVKPDAARIYFGVQTAAKTIQEARKENNERSRKVIDALRALNIPDLKMKTADINVQVVYERQQDELHLPAVLGYRVTNSFTALVHDKDSVRLGGNASRVLDTALENGANFVQQMVAFREDEAEVRREGLSKAVEAALANANAIAEGAKVRIKDTFSLQGQPEYSYGPGQCGLTNRIVVAGEGGAGDTPVIVGDLEVTIRVSVTCTY
ncbi:MAG TPA: SIMPL domain-containing protein [Gemmataceae bacterium]|jgi:hypothetical protein|nr:SIMPL domain-containing protein [Gemmataceae bacterium]